MDVFERSLEMLEKYLIDTNPDEILKEMNRIDAICFEDGFTFDEYLSEFEDNYDLFQMFESGSPKSDVGLDTFIQNSFLSEFVKTFKSKSVVKPAKFNSNISVEYNVTNNNLAA